MQVNKRFRIDKHTHIFKVVKRDPVLSAASRSGCCKKDLNNRRPWMPRRSPPSSGETPSLAIATRIRFRARSVTWIPF